MFKQKDVATHDKIKNNIFQQSSNSYYDNRNNNHYENNAY